MSVRQGRYALAVLAMATAAFGAPLDLSLDAYRVAAADGATAERWGRLILAGHDLHPWENHLRLSRERQSSTSKNIHSAALGHSE